MLLAAAENAPFVLVHATRNFRRYLQYETLDCDGDDTTPQAKTTAKQNRATGGDGVPFVRVAQWSMTRCWSRCRIVTTELMIAIARRMVRWGRQALCEYENDGD